MNDKEFRELVQSMRASQIEYFSTRDSGILSQAKRLERLVDYELSGQTNLF